MDRLKKALPWEKLEVNEVLDNKFDKRVEAMKKNAKLLEKIESVCLDEIKKCRYVDA